MEVETQPLLANIQNSSSSSSLFPHHSSSSTTTDFSLDFNFIINNKPSSITQNQSKDVDKLIDDLNQVGEISNKCETNSTKISSSIIDLISINQESIKINGQEETESSESTTKTITSSAAVKVQKVYRSYRTRRRLADSAVVAEELWWQALDFARLNHSTISFFNFEKSESVVSRWNRITLNVSKVGKGLSKDAKAQKLAFQHWIEAIDPRHRYGHSLHLYYEQWCNADAGQPFFYWLDIGDGKDVELKECPRSKLRQQCIKYLGPQEREHYEYIVIEGNIVHKQSGELLDTTKGSQGAKWIFVMSTFNKLYAGEKKKGIFHHSSFLAGGVTLAAGRLVAVNGVLKSIWAYSGHYRPTDDNLNGLLDFLKENGVSMDEVEIRSSTEDYENNGDSKSNPGETAVGVPSKPLESSDPKPAPIEIPKMGLKYLPEPDEATPKGSGAIYKRTLSGGLQSPRAEVPKNKLLQRINSKKIASSYQLGRQVSLKWSTGVGPRIGCVADYPLELRLQALEFVNLSPRIPPTPSSRQLASLISPTSRMNPDICNLELNSQPVLSR
ncbi:hypothetical protein AQUCO_00400055v1 [Aquilegia coerulea]|uniref:IQ domain-containing protein IQM3 n=1 Tax=Aquilegia coerulea TaxID=218851 RepID=A0A2G5ET62_AQUCA|nr:hypothetical protein AQUCO_00400055v1 [Aquilegia coerulea]